MNHTSFFISANKIADLEATLKAYETKIDSLTSDLDSANDMMSTSQKSHLEIQHEKEKALKKVQDELDEAQVLLKEKNAELKRAQDDFNSATEELELRNSKLNERLKTLEAQNEHMKNLGSEHEFGLASAKQTIETLEGEIEKLNVEKEKLTMDHETLVKEKEREHEQSKSLIVKLQSDIENLEQKLRSGEELVGTNEQEMAGLREQVTVLENSIEDSKVQRDKMRDGYESSIAELQEKLKMLKDRGRRG